MIEPIDVNQRLRTAQQCLQRMQQEWRDSVSVESTAIADLFTVIDELQAIAQDLHGHQDMLLVAQAEQERTQQQYVAEQQCWEMERQAVENTLREKEQVLQFALAGAQAGSWSWDIATGKLFWSPEMYRLYGLDPAEGELDYERWYNDLIHPDERLWVQDYITQAINQSESPFQCEFRIIHPEYGVRWMLSLGRVILDSEGTPLRLSGINLDISDRKQAELRLQQQLSQMELISDICQDIRQSLDLNQVLSRTVERIRELLQTDRVIVFQLRGEQQGNVIMESVGEGWTSILSTTISDPCFSDRYTELYRQGRIGSLCNIHQGNLEPCHVELLQQFQVQAHLVVPLLQSEHLWGLLIVHHCSAPRHWQPSEIDLLRQLATHVSIAIQQSELYERTRYELLERERMQAVLEENEERFRSLNAAAPIAICHANADGLCLYNNARWQEMSGLSFEESLGDGWLAAVHPDDKESLFNAWNIYVQDNKEFFHEFRLVTPQQEVRWLATRASAMKSSNGEVIGYVSIAEDITERRRAEQKIREQAGLLDIASDAIFVRDLNHRILYWNRGAERLYGWQASEAVGQSAHLLLYTQASQLSTIMTTLLEHGEWQGELQNRTKIGKEVTVQSRWNLVRDCNGRAEHILSVDTDVTEKKQLEAQFYRTQRLESLGTLTSGIAHDLNNVLTPILAISQLLRLQQVDADPQIQEMLNVLESSAHRGAEMISQILSFTRGTEGECGPVDVATVLQEVVTVLQQSFSKSITVRCTVPSLFSAIVSADSTYLHQVFMNLCVNARDAMPNGGTLLISAERCFIDQAFVQTNLDAHVGNYVVISITDTGTGIPPDVRDRMFEPFFTTKNQGEGTGLGLSTVLGIVKNYGGFLQVFSEVGCGTQVKVCLPLVEETPQPESSPTLQMNGNGEMILVVDDDDDVQQSMQSLLERHLYTVMVAQDATEAIALYRQHQQSIRLVILDIMMPGMSGISLIQKLREINSRVKIVAISGLPNNRAPALRAGASTFLPKPYTVDELLETLYILISS